MESIIAEISNKRKILEIYLSNINQSQFEKYFLFCDNIKENNSFNKESDIENHGIIYDLLNQTYDTNIFKLLKELFFNTKRICTLETIILKNYKAVVELSEDKIFGEKIILELYPYMKKSDDFIYLHESTHGLFYKSRVGQKCIYNRNTEVLPYFVTLYAFDKLNHLYPLESNISVLSQYTKRLSEFINFIINKFTDKNLDNEIIYDYYLQSIGIIKSIALLKAAKENIISYETIFNSIINNSLIMGKEFNYVDFEIDKIWVINSYFEFLKENYKFFDSLLLTRK